VRAGGAGIPVVAGGAFCRDAGGGAWSRLAMRFAGRSDGI
jgi:hypothetical protein